MEGSGSKAMWGLQDLQGRVKQDAGEKEVMESGSRHDNRRLKFMQTSALNLKEIRE